MVMMGHDAIPHFHEDNHYLPEEFSALSQSSNDGLTDLQDAFTHFQHSTADGNLVYLSSSENVTNFQKKFLYDIPFVFAAEYRRAWYANYKKHRFREHISVPSSFNSKYSCLRGPPSC